MLISCDVPDNPDRVGSPDDSGAVLCDGCNDILGTPFYDCDGLYVCRECMDKFIDDTKRAPSGVRIWLKYMVQDFEEYTLPEKGDRE